MVGERDSGLFTCPFLCTSGFRETPNLEADMYLEYSGASVLNWGDGRGRGGEEENCVINYRVQS